MRSTSSLLGACALFAAVPLAAQTVVLEPVRDNTLIEESSGALSNGAGPILFAGRVRGFGGGAIRRAVMAFDVAASVPAGSTIDAVTLTMTCDSVATPTPRDVSLHVLTADWGEGTSSSTGGGGALSTPGDATWIHTFFSASLWASAGGDFVGAASATTSVADLDDYDWSSAQMAADVQAWLDAPAANFGWILIGEESVLETTKRFRSRETMPSSARPRLTVEYTPPCTAAAASRNGGANPASYASGTMVLGGTFVGTVDNALAGQATSRLFAFDTPFSLTLSGGQTLLCLDLGSGELLSGGGVAPTSSAGGVDTYSLPVPSVPALCGFALCSQAIQFGSPPFALSNARDLTLGS